MSDSSSSTSSASTGSSTSSLDLDTGNASASAIVDEILARSTSQGAHGQSHSRVVVPLSLLRALRREMESHRESAADSGEVDVDTLLEAQIQETEVRDVLRQVCLSVVS